MCAAKDYFFQYVQELTPPLNFHDGSSKCFSTIKEQIKLSVTAALRVTLRDMTETYVAVAWDRAVPDDDTS